jgi:hypothetical protein
MPRVLGQCMTPSTTAVHPMTSTRHLDKVGTGLQPVLQTSVVARNKRVTRRRRRTMMLCATAARGRRGTRSQCLATRKDQGCHRRRRRQMMMMMMMCRMLLDGPRWRVEAWGAASPWRLLKGRSRRRLDDVDALDVLCLCVCPCGCYAFFW